MNGTPRLRSAYPSTPRTTQKDGRGGTAPGLANGPSSPSEKVVQDPGKDHDAPLIPLNILDGPTQRLSVSIFYLGLTAWRLYDYYKLVSNQTDSLWLFMKWVAIDSVFLFGLPALKIPWLEWSSTVMTVLFLAHAVSNAILMFRIPIPLEAWLIALTKTMYDRELAVSERRVKPASILHNSSLILGKQIIHILPEGSAMLNPGQSPFCISSSTPSVDLPLRINQTNPILIELLRFDYDTDTNETITISSKEAKKLKRQADKGYGKKDPSAPRTLKISVSKTGLYRLQRVVDESNLEVQRRLSDTLVVRCPSAFVKSVRQDKCTGQLSNFYFQVDATPPFTIKYRRTINSEKSSEVSLAIHPEKLESPTSRQSTAGALVKLDSGRRTDVSWARTQHIEIPINETMGESGIWEYSIDEVEDVFHNKVSFSKQQSSTFQRPTKGSHLDQTFIVHEPPIASLRACSSENPLRVAKGKSKVLAIDVLGRKHHDLIRNHVVYSYVPRSDVAAEQDEALVRQADILLKDGEDGPVVSDPGLYTLTSVYTDYCVGEVWQPSSCLLLNPPEPDLTITSDMIPDKCAGNSIGLLVDLDLIGTPPFEITYMVRRRGGRLQPKATKVMQMRTQLELRPSDAGHYSYEFMEITDSIYGTRSLAHKNLKLEQDVRPPASARIVGQVPKHLACIGESANFSIRLGGEAPWKLEYDILHGKKRDKYTVEGIESPEYQISTKPLAEGGEYLLGLTSVTDKSGCKVLLEEDARVVVRHHRPEAAFGRLYGKRSIKALEGKIIKLPLKLTGDGPWTVSYRRQHESKTDLHEAKMRVPNEDIEVNMPGVYEIMSVTDNECPGTVDASANQFEVSSIERPTVQVVSSSSIESIGGTLIKKSLCKGDQDAMELSFTGNPPYHVKYEVHVKPQRGSASVSRREETAGLNAASVRMETSQAGIVEYKITELGDQLYEHDRRSFSPLKVQQTVYSRPSAAFNHIGKSYSYCRDEAAGDKVIPINLVGTPPFSIDVGIRNHATTKPEIISVPNIDARTYNLQIPHRLLALGSHSVTIRKVQDANGCQRVMEINSPSVQVVVVDIPSISPLEATADYCVGDRISYTLSGTPPFNVFYVFNGAERKAAASTTHFRRIAEKPGEFTITGVSDKVSTDACKARLNITKFIHGLPSVRISKGRTAEVDIHEGGEADLLFEFGGTPPFEFTYTRSTNAAKGKKSVVLETKHEVSDEYSKSVKVSEEGTYEVVAIKDRYCGFSTQRVQGNSRQQLLTF